MAFLFRLFHLSAFWAAHCPSWSVKPLAFSVLSFWRTGEGNAAQKPNCCMSVMEVAWGRLVYSCFILPITRRGVRFVPLHFSGRQEEGLSPYYGAGRCAFP